MEEVLRLLKALKRSRRGMDKRYKRDYELFIKLNR